MGSSDTAAVIVAGISGAAVVLLLWAVLSLTRTLRALRESVEELRRETLPIVSDLRLMVDQTADELDRAEDLLSAAESISATADFAYKAVANPVIKTMALASGTGRAARSLRRRAGRGKA